jgi:uncharacterized protein YdhG (YjbR/CyaY superfamily)
MAPKPQSTTQSTVASQIRAYHAGLPPAARKVLKALLAEVRAAAPSAAPALSYRIPAFVMGGRVLVWCAAWKAHVSLYPVTRAMQEAGGTALVPYRHAKGTVRFAIDTPLPRPLIRRLIKARAAEMARG